MVTLLKLGGSLITDKNQRSTFRQDVMTRVANEIRTALSQSPEMKLIIGHGSGSFGHYEAKEHNTINGVRTADEWKGFAKVATIAAELNYLVANILHEANIPALRIQPSASSLANDGIISDMSITSIQRALEHNLVPLIYGDVAFDKVRGGTITSTETIFAYLVSHLPIKRIILLGEVDGVYDSHSDVIDTITPKSFALFKSALQGSGGVDVTGGMLTKVQDMLQIVSTPPYPNVQIINGNTNGIILDALLGKSITGTTIEND